MSEVNPKAFPLAGPDLSVTILELVQQVFPSAIPGTLSLPIARPPPVDGAVELGQWMNPPPASPSSPPPPPVLSLSLSELPNRLLWRIGPHSDQGAVRCTHDVCGVRSNFLARRVLHA